MMAKKFAVIHPGARLGYALPHALHLNGLLQKVYTDVCGSLKPIRAIGSVIPEHLQGDSFKRLLGRRLPPGLPDSFVQHEWSAAIVAALFKTEANIADVMCRAAVRDNFGGADALMTLYYDSAMMKAARDRGMFLAQEYYASPTLPCWTAEECRRFPETFRETEQDLDRHIEHEAEKFKFMNRTIVPSDFVLRECHQVGIDTTNTAVVPYSISLDCFNRDSSPIIGRVLYAGSIAPAKGVQYLAAAARSLRRRRVGTEVHVVGALDPSVFNQALFDGLVLRGPCPRDEIWHSYAQADVFVFPSLCDSFGMVQLEAMAYGVPVVTTPNSAGIVRHGKDGFVCDIRDHAQLEAYIERIVTDRKLRSEMSQNARERAAQYNFVTYANSISQALAVH